MNDGESFFWMVGVNDDRIRFPGTYYTGAAPVYTLTAIIPHILSFLLHSTSLQAEPPGSPCVPAPVASAQIDCNVSHYYAAWTAKSPLSYNGVGIRDPVL